MGRSSIKHIRQYKNKKAKIGMRVTYDGHPYRIAWTCGDGLRLRSELLVHPNDPGINYDPGDVAVYTQKNIIEKQAKRIRELEMAVMLSGACLSHHFGDSFPEDCSFEVNMAFAAIEACGKLNVDYPEADKEIRPLLEKD